MPSDLIGRTIGQYKVIKELGRGGAARVFRAYDEQNLRPVAFKALRIETDDRVSFMQRFAREAEIIRTLDHPNIVQVYDAGETDEFVYLVLRLVEGGTLRQRIATQRLSTQAACQYMIQIAHALHHAHKQGIIHRDVKPSNMLLDDEQPGRILLSDFGTAKILNAQGLTKTGATVGTPEYMSPEQAEGREVNQRSDIYSLGCALYEALAGRPPFIGTTSLSVLYQQVHAQPTYIRSYNAEAPRELWKVLSTCLAKRPEDRYGSAERLAEDLLPFAEGLIQPTPAPWNSPITGRISASDLAGPSSRPLRESLPTPQPVLPPPFTPAPTAVTPGMHGMNGVVNGQIGDGAGPIPLYLEGRAPTSRPAFTPRGPRPTLRLPSATGRPGLLSGSAGALTPEARQAVSEFEAQIEADERQAPAARAETGAPPADIYPTVPTPVAGQRAPTSGPAYRGATSGPMGGAPTYRAPVSGPYRAPTSGPYRAPTSGPYRAPVSGPYRGATSGSMRAPNSAGRRAVTSIPVDVGRLRADVDPVSLGYRRRGKRRSPLLAMSIAVVVLLAIGVVFGMGGLKLFAQQAAPPRPTPHPIATHALPTPTATIAKPTATATPNTQQLLNSQAASAFRAITIASFSDSACSSGSNATHFGSGSPVYINLCMAGSPAPGPVTVVVRHNGSIVRTLIANLYPSVGAYYTQGHTLGGGSYDMLVTMQINGKQAVAKDIPFTVQ